MSLLRAREAVMTWYRPLLADLDLTEQQWRVIRVLFEVEALEISELARRTSVLPPSMSGILKRLESRNLVIRTPDSEDHRRSRISLAPAAESLMRAAGPRSEIRRS